MRWTFCVGRANGKHGFALYGDQSAFNPEFIAWFCKFCSRVCAEKRSVFWRTNA